MTNLSTNFYSLISPCIHHTMIMKWRTVAFAVFIFRCNFPFLLSLWTNVYSFSCCRWTVAFPSRCNTLQSFQTDLFIFDLLHDIHALHFDVNHYLKVKLYFSPLQEATMTILQWNKKWTSWGQFHLFSSLKR